MWSLKHVHECLCCGSRDLVPYLDLGRQPLANNYHQGVTQTKYALAVQVCSKCFHSQLEYFVPPQEMFDSYFYVSGTSQSLTEYFHSLAETILSRWEGAEPPKVLEIASNDGTLLKILKDHGCQVLGVDPAQNVGEICRQNGVECLTAYWNEETASVLCETFDVVIAVNVLPHVPDPRGFLDACRKVLKPGGRLYLQTSQFDMFRNGEFDAVYHEHHSYFTASSLATLLHRAGFVVGHAVKVPIHSTSILMECHTDRDRGHSDSMSDLVREEARLGWHTIEKYFEFAGRAEECKITFTALLQTLKNKFAGDIVGYGASAKSSTVFNYFGVDIDYFVDDNPMKHGYKTPGRNIPIHSPDVISPDPHTGCPYDIVIVLTAWNFKSEILEKIKLRRPLNKDVYISYIPEVEYGKLSD